MSPCSSCGKAKKNLQQRLNSHKNIKSKIENNGPQNYSKIDAKEMRRLRIEKRKARIARRNERIKRRNEKNETNKKQ